MRIRLTAALVLLLAACSSEGGDPDANGTAAEREGGSGNESGDETGLDAAAGGTAALGTGGAASGATSGGVTGSGGSEPGSGGTSSASGGSATTGTGGETTLAEYPTDLIPGLPSWKITLPVDEDGDDSSDADDVDDRNTDAWEVVGNDLIDFDYPPYFTISGSEVLFRAHAAGATTSGSKYPRSELRQLVGGGDNYWSVEKRQYLQTELRVTHLPEVKPEVSMVQIHGPEDEPLRVQYHEDVGVYVIWNEDNKDTDNALDYTLGERLRITVLVEDGDIRTDIDNLDQGTHYDKTWTSSDSTGYFKVGCYTQSSIFLSEFKDEYDDDESMDAYGEVAVSSIELSETYP